MIKPLTLAEDLLRVDGFREREGVSIFVKVCLVGQLGSSGCPKSLHIWAAPIGLIELKFIFQGENEAGEVGMDLGRGIRERGI